MKKVMLTGLVCLFGNLVFAGVTDLEQLQAAHSNLVYQYTFEGPDDTGRLDMKATPNSPSLTARNTTGFAVSFASGYDSSSVAASTAGGRLSKGQRGTGAALKATGPLQMPVSGTIEYMFKASTLNDQGFLFGGLACDGGRTSRWIFCSNSSTNTPYTAYMTLGSTASATTLIGRVATGVDYVTNHWYYVAQTWNIVGSTVMLNAWVADMSVDNGRTLVKTINGVVTPMTRPNTNWTMRIGSNTDGGNYFSGSVDAVAVYNTQLDASTIESHFSAIK